MSKWEFAIAVRDEADLASGHKRKKEHKEVLINLLNYFNSSEYDDVAYLIHGSGSLSLFAGPILRLIIFRPEYWNYLTLTFILRIIRRIIELKAKKYFPKWLSRLCLNFFYNVKR